MCEPVTMTAIAIGAATGAAGAAITGGDILQGALLGGIMGGATAGMGGFAQAGIGGATESGFMTTLGGNLFPSMGQSAANAFGMSAAQAAAATTTGLVGSIGMGVLFPQGQEAPAYDQSAYGYSPIAYNSVHNTVTGSGGVQASAVLASEIKKAKSNRKKQQSTGDTYVNTESFANTGLQLA